MERIPMTVEGFKKLEEELHRLKSEERPRIIQQIAEARANLALTQKELQRQTNLVREQAGTAQALDVARSNYQAAQARLNQLQAQVNQSRANLADTSYQLSERSITARTCACSSSRRSSTARHSGGVFMRSPFAGCGATLARRR